MTDARETLASWPLLGGGTLAVELVDGCRVALVYRNEGGWVRSRVPLDRREVADLELMLADACEALRARGLDR